VEVVAFALQLALTIALTAGVVRRDERRLPPERLARAWNVASFCSAVVAFGPLCIPVHFVRTRRNLIGVLLGLLWTAIVLATLAGIGTALEALGEPLG
jgi:purine-cytosine permease-like protein